ncbi:MAG: carboxylesterase/lipase family protein [Lautropia sp.]
MNSQIHASLERFVRRETDAGVLLGSVAADAGREAPTVVSFKGIPFAAPPTGRRRWRAPEPAARWTGERPALAFGRDCPQAPDPQSRAPGMSEDCLFLNIWAPADARPGSLPVMVWVHGGSFVSGSGSDRQCDGAALAGRGVVVVTFNYRVGIFGFLAHPALSDESPHAVSGNYGLLDQIAALEWIQRNISGFGGDPSAVTLFGVSAGASSILLLLGTPLTDGLFQRVILQSPGCGRSLASLRDAESAGSTVAPDLGSLRAGSSRELLALTARLVPKRRSLTGARVLRPIRDGWLITENERSTLRAGNLRALPMLIGGNVDEGSMLTADWGIETVARYHQLLVNDFGADAVLMAGLYRAGRDDEVKRRVAEVFADTQFNYGVRLLARSWSRLGRPAWRYLFARCRARRSDGPHHTDELPYVFDNLDAVPIVDPIDRAVSAAMTDAWVEFARKGDPNRPGTPEWPSYDAGSDRYLEFGDSIAIGRAWRGEQLDFIDDYFERRDRRQEE